MWTNFQTFFTPSPFFPLFEPFLLMTNLDFWQLPPQIAVYMVCEWSLMQKYLVIQIRPQPAAGWAPVFVCQIQVAAQSRKTNECKSWRFPRAIKFLLETVFEAATLQLVMDQFWVRFDFQNLKQDLKMRQLKSRAILLHMIRPLMFYQC